MAPAAPAARTDRPRLSRRRLVGALAATLPVVAGTAGGACSPAGPGAAPPSGAAPKPVALGYWHTWTAHWEEMTRFVARAFQERHPQITVTSVVVSGAPLLDKLAAAAAAATPPDVATVYSAINIPTLAE